MSWEVRLVGGGDDDGGEILEEAQKELRDEKYGLVIRAVPILIGKGGFCQRMCCRHRCCSMCLCLCLCLYL